MTRRPWVQARWRAPARAGAKERVPELERRYGGEGSWEPWVADCRGLVRARSLSSKQREAVGAQAPA